MTQISEQKIGGWGLCFGYEISTPLLSIHPAVRNRGWIAFGEERDVDSASQTDLALIKWEKSKEMIAIVDGNQS